MSHGALIICPIHFYIRDHHVGRVVRNLPEDGVVVRVVPDRGAMDVGLVEVGVRTRSFIIVPHVVGTTFSSTSSRVARSWAISMSIPLQCPAASR